VDGGSTTKDAIIDYLFKKRSRYLRAEAIDKLFPRDQTFLLNLMEKCKVSETKHRKARKAAKNHNIYIADILMFARMYARIIQSCLRPPLLTKSYIRMRIRIQSAKIGAEK
jgi:hypothetical protein